MFGKMAYRIYSIRGHVQINVKKSEISDWGGGYSIRHNIQQIYDQNFQKLGKYLSRIALK